MNSGKSSADREGNVTDFKCEICGKHFDSLGDMQRHTTVEHIQKGEIPSKTG